MSRATVNPPMEQPPDDAVRAAPDLPGPIHRPGVDAESSALGRLAVVVIGAGLAIVVILWGEPLGVAAAMLFLAAMVAAVIVAPVGSPDRWGLVAALPAGFVLLLCWGLLWGLSGGAFDRPTWGSRGASLMGVAVLAVICAAVARHRGGRVAAVGRDWPAAAGALCLLAFFAWVVASQPMAWWSRINATGTDFLRHVRFIRMVREDGLLTPGELVYPRALHAPVAWLTTAMGLPDDASTLWRALAPVGFLMLSLMLLSVVLVAVRLTDLVYPGPGPALLAGTIGAVAFVQTAWFDTFLALGSLMNMVAALALLTLLVAGLRPRAAGSLSTSVTMGGVLAVVANSYPLVMPAAGIAALPWIVQFLRWRWRSVLGWATWLLSGLLVMHGMGVRPLSGGAGYSASGVSSTTSAPAVSDLFRPDWWWWATLVMSVVMAVIALRRGRRTWALSYIGLVAAAAAVVGILLRTSGSSWELLRYYPAKTLWTYLVVVVPVASAAVVVLVGLSWRRSASGSPLAAGIVRGAIVLVIGVAAAGVLGRGAAFPPHVASIASGRAGAPNWPLALIESIGSKPISADPGAAALVLGIVPSADVNLIRGGYVGAVDSMSMEALAHVGWEAAFADPVKIALATRDTEGICDFLRQNPAALRIVGPNPSAGPGWLVASGCPIDVVDPGRWVILDIDRAWLDRSPWQDGGWTLPTFADVTAADPRKG